MNGLLHEMEAEEIGLLAVRVSDEQAASKRVVLSTATAAVMLSALLWITYIVMRRQSRDPSCPRRSIWPMT